MGPSTNEQPSNKTIKQMNQINEIDQPALVGESKPTCDLTQVLEVVGRAKSTFADRLQAVEENGGLTEDMYVRYLSFQYHLTKGVQRAFFKVAGHPQLSGKNRLRQFLFKFALEEEPHYKVAEVDLERMG